MTRRYDLGSVQVYQHYKIVSAPRDAIRAFSTLLAMGIPLGGSAFPTPLMLAQKGVARFIQLSLAQHRQKRIEANVEDALAAR
jgi:hypothetical protein